MPSQRVPGTPKPCAFIERSVTARVAVERGAHPELVVDDHEDHRQLPERGEVHRLAERALVRGAVAHHREDHVLGVHVVGRERDAGGQRQRAADDPVATEEALVPVEQVHGAAAAGRAAALTAEQLRHHLVGMCPARDRLAVLAVGRHQVVGLLERLGGAHDRRLLADAEVEEAADLRLGVHLAGALLEATDEEHLLEHGEAGVLVGEAVLDLAEADLLEADYVARALTAVFALAVSALLGTVSRLGGVTGSHWPGEYPSLAPFNSHFPRLGGGEPVPHTPGKPSTGMSPEPNRHAHSRTSRCANGDLLGALLRSPAEPHLPEATPPPGRKLPLRGGRRRRTARPRRRWSGRHGHRGRTPPAWPPGAGP